MLNFPPEVVIWCTLENVLFSERELANRYIHSLPIGMCG